jgi:transcriptional regulator with GAF, ATPase, and Fis domain
MHSADALAEGVRILLRDAAEVLPVRGLGVVHEDGPEHVIFNYGDGFGATAYRCIAAGVPEGLRPREASRGLTRIERIDLEANPDGLVETRILHPGCSLEIRREFAVHQAVAIGVPDEAATLVIAIAEPMDLTASHTAAIEGLAARVADFMRRVESDEEERELSRRLEVVAGMLPALIRVLDIREIFDQVSSIAKDVLRHDFASLGLFEENLTHLVLYVQTAGGPFEFRSGPMPFPPVQTAHWLYRFLDDLSTSPLERDGDSLKAGGRSSIRVAIRFDDTILGALQFTSRDPAPYTAADLAVCRRIAEYVAIALWHQRLAEEARLNEELRARAANLELLDELLATLSNSGELPLDDAALGRLSSLARKVLAHDALELSVLLADGRRARRYVCSAGDLGKLPELTTIARAAAKRDWEYDVIDDAKENPDEAGSELAAAGMRSILRVPVRLDGEVAAVLTFFARTAATFRTQDVLVARRIADRIALGLLRERGLADARRAEEASARVSSLEARVRVLMEELDARTGLQRVVGKSAQWRQVLTQATQVAATETTVLLVGESGTGKEVIARLLHRASPRNGGPFVALNCAALPEHLLEAELFGYERGAFTGATQSKPGQLELAAGGTLFLDEIGEMSPSAQAKLLRVLQEREFQRLGGTRVLRTDARIVAATNRNLQRAIANGLFREDLYYRLNVFAIELPPLRDRREDILPLSEAFLSEIARGLGHPPSGVSRDARSALVGYHWPGNVRELRNILERAAILCEGGLITPEHLAIGPAAPAAPPVPATAVSADGPPVASAGDLDLLERSMVEHALRAARFNKSKAAKALGLTRRQLYVRLRRHGLD